MTFAQQLAAEKADAEQSRRLLYDANMMLMQQFDLQGKIPRVAELLAETKEFGRNTFEWGYWHREFNKEERRLAVERGYVAALVFSPDSKMLAGCDSEGKILLWNVITGQKIKEIASKESPFQSLQFSPNGKQIARGDASGAIQVFDIETGTLKQTFSHSLGEIVSLHFSADVKKVLAAGKMDVSVFDLETNKHLKTFHFNTNHQPICAFSEDGKGVIAVFREGNSQKLSLFADEVEPYFSELLSPPNRSEYEFALALTSESRFVRVPHPSSNRMQWGRERVSSAEYIGRDYDAVLLPIIPPKQNPVYQTLTYLEDRGSTLIVRQEKRQNYNGDSFQTELLKVRSSQNGFGRAILSPDGRYLAAVEGENGILLWNIEQEAQNNHPLLAAAMSRVIGVSPDGQRIIWQDNTGAFFTGDLAGKTERGRFGDQRAERSNSSLSGDGKRVIAAEEGSRVGVWEAESGKKINELAGHNQKVFGATLSYDGKRVATCDAGGTVIVWDTDKGTKIREIKVNEYGIDTVALSPDGKRLAYAEAQSCKVIEIETGKHLYSAQSSFELRRLSFSPDGKKLIGSGFSAIATVWSAISGEEIFSLKGHTGVISDVRFSPDGSRILTACQDGTVRIWDAETGRELLMLSGAGKFTYAMMTQDNKQVIAVAGFSQIHRWLSDAGKEK